VGRPHERAPKIHAEAGGVVNRQGQAAPVAPSIYPSKRDRWLEIVVWMASLLSIGAGLSSFALRAGPGISLLLMALCLAAGAFMLWSFYGTNYTLLADRLVVRSGPFRFRVLLAEITSIAPSRNPISSPACSLDRLEIRYRGGRSRILISPEDKPGFLEALALRCEGLVRLGDRLVLRGPA